MQSFQKRCNTFSYGTGWCETAAISVLSSVLVLEVIREVLPLIKLERNQLLNFFIQEKKKKKKPSLKKTLQTDLSLKSLTQEVQSTYESMRARKEQENLICSQIRHSLTMSERESFNVCISYLLSLPSISHVTSAVS